MANLIHTVNTRRGSDLYDIMTLNYKIKIFISLLCDVTYYIINTLNILLNKNVENP